jgi:hypothetical protein
MMTRSVNWRQENYEKKLLSVNFLLKQTGMNREYAVAVLI